MTCAMEEAGLLNSMSVEDLKVTCERLERSCQDMEMLLNEFVEEQAMLQQEQDRLHQRVEKATARMKQGRQDQSFIGNLLNDMELQLEVSNLLSNIFRAKQERKVAKRRRWTASGDTITSGTSKNIIPEGEQDDDEVYGPFSGSNVEVSWACDVTCGKLHQAELKEHGMTELARWVREAMCGDPVAEAEALPDAMWAAQLAASQAMRLPEASPGSKSRATPGSSPTEGLGGLTFFSEFPSGSPPGGTPAAERSTSRQQRVEFGPDGVQVSPEASGAEDNNSFDTLMGSALGIMSAVGGHNVAEKVAQKVAAAQEVAQQARAAAKAGVDSSGSGADMPAAPSFSRRMQEAGAVIGFFADYWNAGNLADPSTSRGEVGETQVTISFTVVLKRSSDAQRWGLAWIKDGFKQNKERVVESLVPDSVADHWNRLQEQSGHPELCIRPVDRLNSANGRTDRDEMTTELQGKDVVLEFHRTVHRPVAEPDAQKAAPAGSDASHPAPSMSSRDARKQKFQAAFTAYLQNKAPGSFSPEKPIPEGRAVEAEVEAEPKEETPQLEEQPESPSKSLTRQALLQEALQSAEDEVEEDLDEKQPACEVPYGVFAQVMSLGAGSVRLSWLFDWEAAPAELRAEEWAERGFEVFRRFGEVQQESGDSQEEEVTRCTKPPASLDLPTGRKHRLQVRATLVDNRGGVGGSPLWSSPLSAAVAADLRAAPGSGLAKASSTVPTVTAETASAAQAEASAPASAAAPASAEAVEPAKADVQQPAPLAPKPKGRVAANFADFLAKRPAAAQPASQASSSSSGGSPRKVVMGGSAPAPTFPSALAQASKDPLASAQPKVVSGGSLDPVAEKWEMSQRLRLRAGHPGTRERSSVLDMRPRSSSFDSDDEDSLAKISSALSSLEKTQAALKQRDSEAVAEEGHHSLQQRLDAGGSSSQEPLRAAGAPSPAAAAAAAAAAARMPGRAVPPPADEDGPDPQPLGAAISTAGTSGFEESSPASATFRLRVQLANYQTAMLEFRPDEDLPRCVSNLVAKYHMRDVCEKPLLERAEELLRSGKKEESVDVVDLM